MPKYQRQRHVERGAEQQRPQSAWDLNNFLCKILYFYMCPVFNKARLHGLSMDDTWQPPQVDACHRLGQRLHANYNEERIRCKGRSFFRALVKTFGRQLALLSLLELVSKCVAIPMLCVATGWLIRHVSLYLTISQVLPFVSSKLFLLLVFDVTLIVICAFVALFLSQPYSLQSLHIGMKCRVATSYLIYRKCLKLSQFALNQKLQARQAEDLISKEISKFDRTANLSSYILIAPLQAIVMFVLMAKFYLSLYSVLAIILTCILYIAIQTVLGKEFGQTRYNVCYKTERRIVLTGAILNAIRVIKVFAWEMPFKKLIDRYRERELRSLSVVSMSRTVISTLFYVSPKIIIFSGILTQILLGYDVTAEAIFVPIAMINFMRVSLTMLLPSAVAYFAETVISCRKIDQFLMLPDRHTLSAHYIATIGLSDRENAVTMRQVCSNWQTSDDSSASSDTPVIPIIKNVDMILARGELIAVMGAQKSGKTSLLMTILGEIPIMRGRLDISGTISYAPQEPWILPQTLRENILFGAELDHRRYNLVCRACGLDRDFRTLKEGDLTNLGADDNETRLTLSGCQRARICFARCLYRQADIYIIDDILCNVDDHIGRHIISNGIHKFLKKKTLIWVTNKVEFAKQANKLLLIDKETHEVAFGQPDKVFKSDLFGKLELGALDQPATKGRFKGESLKRVSPSPRKRKSSPSLSLKFKEFSLSRESMHQMDTTSPVESIAMIPMTRLASTSTSGMSLETATKYHQASQITPSQEAHLPDSQAGLSNLSYYLENFSPWYCLAVFCLVTIVTQILYQLTDYELSLWVDMVAKKKMDQSTDAKYTVVLKDTSQEREMSTLYGILTLACLLTAFLKSILYFLNVMRASYKIHEKLLATVMRMPLSFFDSNPLKAIVGRISKDLSVVDEAIPIVLLDVIVLLSQLVGSLIMLLYLDWLAVVGVVFLIVAISLARWQTSTARIQLKELESNAKAPIVSFVTASLDGVTSIRAFGEQDFFSKEFERFQDNHTGVWFMLLLSRQSLVLMVDIIVLVLLILLLTIKLNHQLESSNPAFIGLFVTQLQMLMIPLHYGLMQLAELQTCMPNLLRIINYTRLQPEEQLDLEDHPLDITKLNFTGRVEFNEISLVYPGETRPALSDVTMRIQAGQKVAIVGRVGSGKSSVLATLFRMYQFSGQVEIDGIDTSKLSLRQLRGSISMIMQDPVLFGASLRKNLDLFNEHQDSELWAALEIVQLRNLFESNSLSSRSLGLNTPIQERGSPLTVGQRQLLCLARAILRQNQIVVFDEATANVDPQTATLIRDIISQRFSHCTVIIIPHKLDELADCDMVAVLVRGRLREFDKPSKLLQDSESSLNIMLSKLEDAEANRVRSKIISSQRESSQQKSS